MGPLIIYHLTLLACLTQTASDGFIMKRDCNFIDGYAYYATNGACEAAGKARLGTLPYGPGVVFGGGDERILQYHCTGLEVRQ